MPISAATVAAADAAFAEHIARVAANANAAGAGSRSNGSSSTVAAAAGEGATAPDAAAEAWEVHERSARDLADALPALMRAPSGNLRSALAVLERVGTSVDGRDDCRLLLRTLAAHATPHPALTRALVEVGTPTWPATTRQQPPKRTLAHTHRSLAWAPRRVPLVS
jgi:hypothetical protein